MLLCCKGIVKRLYGGKIHGFFNITQKLEEGDNIIEFTPEEEGTFVFSCRMGMIRSNIYVVN